MPAIAGIAFTTVTMLTTLYPTNPTLPPASSTLNSHATSVAPIPTPVAGHSTTENILSAPNTAASGTEGPFQTLSAPDGLSSAVFLTARPTATSNTAPSVVPIPDQTLPVPDAVSTSVPPGSSPNTSGPSQRGSSNEPPQRKGQASKGASKSGALAAVAVVLIMVILAILISAAIFTRIGYLQAKFSDKDIPWGPRFADWRNKRLAPPREPQGDVSHEKLKLLLHKWVSVPLYDVRSALDYPGYRLYDWSKARKQRKGTWNPQAIADGTKCASLFPEAKNSQRQGGNDPGSFTVQMRLHRLVHIITGIPCQDSIDHVGVQHDQGESRADRIRRMWRSSPDLAQQDVESQIAQHPAGSQRNEEAWPSRSNKFLQSAGRPRHNALDPNLMANDSPVGDVGSNSKMRPSPLRLAQSVENEHAMESSERSVSPVSPLSEQSNTSWPWTNSGQGSVRRPGGYGGFDAHRETPKTRAPRELMHGKSAATARSANSGSLSPYAYDKADPNRSQRSSPVNSAYLAPDAGAATRWSESRAPTSGKGAYSRSQASEFDADMSGRHADGIVAKWLQDMPAKSVLHTGNASARTSGNSNPHDRYFERPEPPDMFGFGQRDSTDSWYSRATGSM